MPQHFLIGDDLHRPSAQNEAWPYQDRITDFLCGAHAFLDIRHGCSRRLRDAQVGKDLFKVFPVFRPFNRRAVRPDQPDTQHVQRLCKVDGGLTAQACDYSLRLFKVDDLHHVFGCQRLKIKLVCSGVVGRNRFRVVIDDDRFVSVPPDCLHCVNRGIVKFDSLPDSDRSCPKHNDLLFPREDALVYPGIGGIQIGNVFPGVQRVHHPEYRPDVFFHAQ